MVNWYCVGRIPTSIGMLPTVFDPSMTKARLMEISESIKWIDDRIFAKTGKRLDSLQISILEATSRGQKYPQIAETYNFSNDHIRKAAWKLWKLLSDVLGESVSQSNFRTLVQRGFFSNSNINNIVNSNNNKINVIDIY